MILPESGIGQQYSFRNFNDQDQRRFMNELIAIFAFLVCAVVITIVIRIYKESPKINKKIERDELN